MNDNPSPGPKFKIGGIIRPDRCEKCKFAEVEPSSKDFVYCHRGPPALTHVLVPAGPSGQGVELKHFSTWPLVSINKWCGEFKPRIEGAN